MRLRHIALGCTLSAALGCLATQAAHAATAHPTTGHPATAYAAAVHPNTGHPNTGTRPQPRLSIAARATDYSYGAQVKFTVILGPPTRNGKVTLYATPYGERRKAVATGHADARGRWYPVYTVSRKTTFTVVFGGDSRSAANTASTTLQVYARVADRLGGSAKTARVGGVSYHVFHARGTLTLYSTVSPAKPGECVEPESQQLDGKTWDADSKYGCDKLSQASQDIAPFTLTQAVGERYRIRGDYFRSAKDQGNLNRQGPWLYFTVGK